LRDRLVNPHRPASAFVPLQQLEGWLEVVGEPAPLLGVEVVHPRYGLPWNSLLGRGFERRQLRAKIFFLLYENSHKLNSLAT
jgi:hypothetical protein